ncbi:Flagellar basal-body rod modification protein FlgD [gamma proteobacterium IMCC1989]|nr:Flagellar basal-body rod modification protein FlgD [gamma proteobacterium IMCC1989]
MEIESIGNSQSNTALQRAGIDQEDFLQVLLAQLNYQDPLEPVDNSEFISQFAELTTLTQTQSSNDKLDSLLTIQSVNQAVQLIGKTVEVNSSGSDTIGQVTTITFSSEGTPQMTVLRDDGGFINGVGLSQISVVRN